MIPIVTPEEMSAVDAATVEPVELLIQRAGAAVAREAIGLTGGTYGRRVSVIVGKGNNGNDGRAAAARLERRGVRVAVVDVAEPDALVPDADLVIDAAYGTGFRGSFQRPALSDGAAFAPVLAVDIPSGLDGLTGVGSGDPLMAERTVTFGALKPGLLQGDGPAFTGDVAVADIGLDIGQPQAHLVQAEDIPRMVPSRQASDHKWKHAVWLVAGSPNMGGAGWLAARSAMRADCGYVRVSSPGVDHPFTPIEAVGMPAPTSGWSRMVVAESARFGAVAVGPGLGLAPNLRRELEGLAGLQCPLVLDGDALRALGTAPIGFDVPVILTPHDGEFEALMGGPPGGDRFAAARAVAAKHNAIVLLKGPVTVVAEPSGRVLVVANGDSRLATAGSGDVLTGILTAYLSLGAHPMNAAAAAAATHGLAGQFAGTSGVLAEDIADAIPLALSSLARS